MMLQPVKLQALIFLRSLFWLNSFSPKSHMIESTLHVCKNHTVSAKNLPNLLLSNTWFDYQLKFD